ncbi:hypothetical protein F5B19DRAFT_452193 [Rostrohypoxylon terebratum]|nr:hypothetical protein F5B19DRAFT_452193 [Rostrohypoxylon terebratum]
MTLAAPCLSLSFPLYSVVMSFWGSTYYYIFYACQTSILLLQRHASIVRPHCRVTFLIETQDPATMLISLLDRDIYLLDKRIVYRDVYLMRI